MWNTVCFSLSIPKRRSPVLLMGGHTGKNEFNTTHLVLFFCSLIGRTQRKVRKDRILSILALRCDPCVASLAACGDPFTIVRNYATQRNAMQRLAEHCELGLRGYPCLWLLTKKGYKDGKHIQEHESILQYLTRFS